MIVIRQLLARIPKVLLLVPVTLVTRVTAKPVASVSCLTLLGSKSIWIACVVNLTLSSFKKKTLASKYTSMINAHKRIKKKKWKCNWELEAYWLVGAAGKVSPNWSQETMIFHSSNSFSNKHCLGSGECTIGDFSSEQLLHDHCLWFTAAIPVTITYHDAFKINSTVVHEKLHYQIQIIHSLQS